MTAITCPVCQGAFKEVVRDGILIDVCTQCKGVWLDRGELEKILAAVRQDESGAPIAALPPSQPPAVYHPKPYPEPYREPYRRERYDDDDDRHYRHKGHYRKKSKLETLFDIFD
ncbi:MAG: zf-TFIIB domain-containing protein [Alphaproteobacteria bacterium]|nr:zf-TFIIB domain-containing protein [Alphaproteobacteria bacterium]